MGFKFGLLSGVMVALAIGGVGPAHAQEVDYGALEQMFGQPVTTSATGSPQLASQAPAPADMQIITANDIRRSGATSIPQILNFVADIDVRNYGALDNSVAIRGFSQSWNPRLLVLVDGRQVYIDDYGYVAWQTIPVQLAEIRQIEIVRGPASALFGFNATSGVINIVTYDPLYDANNVATVGYGTDGTLEGSLVSTLQQAGRYGVRVSIGGIRTNEYSEAGLGNAPTNPHPHMGSFDIDARYKPTPTTEVTADVSDSGANDYGETFFASSVEDYRTRSYKLGFSADTGIGLLSLQGYVNSVQSNVNNFQVHHFNYQNQVTVLQASDLVKFANVHSVRVGLEFRDNRGWEAPYFGTVGYKNFAVDAMWNWQITPQLAFTTAGRVDHLEWNLVGNTVPGNPFTLAQYNRATITAPSFNTGLVYQPTAQDTFRFLIGRGVQAPSLIEDAFQASQPIGGGLRFVEAGDPNLHASALTNYETDYDRSLPTLNSTLSAAVYYQVDQDFLTLPNAGTAQFTPTGPVAVSQNFGSATAFGGEFGINGSSPDGLRWNASYSLFTVHQHLLEKPPVIPFNFSDATPVSEVSFGVGYSIGKWEADAQGKWQSRYTDYYTTGLAGSSAKLIKNYTDLDARIGYDLTKQITLAVAGSELAAPQITTTAALPPDRRVLFTITDAF
ncbi:MAG: TonB-dependent receptor [Acidocella sp.]|nr:TonB-dependent receptor [Acidocella sp.]